MGGMFDDEPITLAEQIRCVEREIVMRAAVYPRWVAAGKISESKAAYEHKAPPMGVLRKHQNKAQTRQDIDKTYRNRVGKLLGWRDYAFKPFSQAHLAPLRRGFSLTE